MRAMLIRCTLIALGLSLAWFFGTRTLSRLIGRFATIRLATLPVSPLDYDPSRLKIGDLFIFFRDYSLADTPSMDLRIYAEPGDRVFLSSGGRTFPLGVRTVSDPHGLAAFEFVPDPGDQVAFIAERSVLAWSTHLELKIMFGSTSPTWRRHIYYHLIWTKIAGDKLDILWRYEQGFYRDRGWDSPTHYFPNPGGLMRADIHTVTPTIQDSLADYLLRAKGWKPAAYRIEPRGPAPGAAGHSDIFAVIFLADMESPHPGGGQSVNLVVDRASHRIVKELGGQ